MELQQAINQVFEELLRSSWDRELQEAVRSRFGEQVLQEAHAVYDAVMDTPIDWQTTDMNSALTIVWDRMVRDYPWLSEKALSSLNYAFIMCWK